MNASKTSALEDRAFTRTDLAATLGGIALLVSLAIPLLGAADALGGRAQCQQNLRLIGQAFSAWAKDHGDRMPWRRVAAEGGTYDTPANGNAWVQFSTLSNHLISPEHLVCPSTSARVASNWTRLPEGGFIHPNFRANAVSYFLGLDVQETAPKSFLAGDRNIKVSGSGQSCDYANVKSASALRAGDERVAWTEAVHGDPGFLLFFDGSVGVPSSKELRTLAGKTEAVHTDNHILLP